MQNGNWNVLFGWLQVILILCNFYLIHLLYKLNPKEEKISLSFTCAIK